MATSDRGVGDSVADPADGVAILCVDGLWATFEEHAAAQRMAAGLPVGSASDAVVAGRGRADRHRGEVGSVVG